MSTKYTFKQEYAGFTGYSASAPPSTITMEVNGELSLPQVLERFEEFLRGAGFFFDGHLDIVNDDEVSQDYDDSDANINLDESYIYGEPSVTFGSMDDNMNVNLNAGAATETFTVNIDADNHSAYYWDKDRNK